MVKEGALCKNCLKKASTHFNQVSHKSNVQKCQKYHHTLLYIKADPRIEEKKVSKDVTHVTSSKRGGEVLLMTRRVKVIAPDSVHPLLLLPFCRLRFVAAV